MSKYIEEFQAARNRLSGQEIRRILLPTDFSRKSMDPLGMAVEFASFVGAELHLLHVRSPGAPPPEEGGFPSPEEVRSLAWSSSPDSLRDRSEKLVANLVVHLETRDSLEVTQTILAYAEEIEADLMIVGTAARTGLARAFLGSIAERLVLYSKCPIVTVAAGSPVRFAPQRPTVLVPIDFSEPSLESLARAVNLCQMLDGLLVVLHVISPTPVPLVYGDVATVVWETEELRPRIEKELEALAEALPSDLRVKTMVRGGAAAQAIVDAAEEVEADLIQIGSHGLTGIGRHLFGSVAQKVLRSSPVPVLIGKSDATAGK